MQTSRRIMIQRKQGCQVMHFFPFKRWITEHVYWVAVKKHPIKKPILYRLSNWILWSLKNTLRGVTNFRVPIRIFQSSSLKWLLLSKQPGKRERIWEVRSGGWSGWKCLLYSDSPLEVVTLYRGPWSILCHSWSANSSYLKLLCLVCISLSLRSEYFLTSFL